MTHPVTDIVGGADVDKGADAALEQRRDVVVCREREHVEVRVESLVDGARAPVECLPADGWIHAEAVLNVLLVEEVGDIPEAVSRDRVSNENGQAGEEVHTA